METYTCEPTKKDRFKNYIVIGYFRQPHKDCEAETQECGTYREAIELKKKWEKERKYKKVYVESY